MNNNMFREKRMRSVLKTLSWRIMGTIATIAIVYIISRKLVLSLGIGFLEVVSKMLIYYLHERLWDRVGWGKIKNSLADLPINKQLNDEHLAVIKKQLRTLGYLDSEK